MQEQAIHSRGISGLLQGATYPFRALSMLQAHPRLWKYIVIPVLVNLVVFILLTSGLLIPGLSYIDTLTRSLPAWLSFVEWLLRLLFVLALLVINGFLLAQFGVALGSPWYTLLSARLEFIRTGVEPPDTPLTIATVLRDIVRALFFQLGRLLLVIVAFVLLLPLNFLPVVGNLLVVAGNSFVGSMLLSLDFLDPPLDRRLLGFRQKLGYLRRYFNPCLGLGLVCLLLVSIPLLNLLTVPLCVVAGTLLYCDQIWPLEHQPRAQRPIADPL